MIILLRWECITLRSLSLQRIKDDLESSLQEVTSQLHNTVSDKEKLAANFEAAEKLYVERIASLQEDIQKAQEEAEKQAERSLVSQSLLDIHVLLVLLPV